MYARPLSTDEICNLARDKISREDVANKFSGLNNLTEKQLHGRRQGKNRPSQILTV